MNRNISGEANGANTALASATPSTTQAEAPSNAVTGMGNASVTHSQTTVARIAASRCASADSPGPSARVPGWKMAGNRSTRVAPGASAAGGDHGAHHNAINSTGANTSPTRIRHRSKACSSGDRG